MADMYADMWLDGADWDEQIGWINPWGGRANCNIKCKYCGRGGYHWKQTEQGWRLFTSNGRMHSCKKYHQLGMSKIEKKPIKATKMTNYVEMLMKMGVSENYATELVKISNRVSHVKLMLTGLDRHYSDKPLDVIVDTIIALSRSYLDLILEASGHDGKIP